MNQQMNRVKEIFRRSLRILLLSLGVFFALLLVLSFSNIPYYAYHWLGTSSPAVKEEPACIVVLGGAGMPSPDGLIRCYYASQTAWKYPKSRIILALPYGEEDSLSGLNLMAHELILRGIDSNRISYEPLGFNTRSQAMHIARMQQPDQPLLLVTSPEHMYRAVKTFAKAGFKKVGGVPAFEIALEAETVKDKERSKDTRVKSLNLRYNMWSYLHYELLVLREYSAIVYYRIKGWI
jgi:uncharacterized SAM-binding protein YcdF (DUF218 family)